MILKLDEFFFRLGGSALGIATVFIKNLKAFRELPNVVFKKGTHA